MLTYDISASALSAVALRPTVDRIRPKKPENRLALQPVGLASSSSSSKPDPRG